MAEHSTWRQFSTFLQFTSTEERETRHMLTNSFQNTSYSLISPLGGMLTLTNNNNNSDSGNMNHIRMTKEANSSVLAFHHSCCVCRHMCDAHVMVHTPAHHHAHSVSHDKFLLAEECWWYIVGVSAQWAQCFLETGLESWNVSQHTNNDDF